MKIAIGCAGIMVAAGLASGQVFFDEASWEAAAVGPIVSPDFLALGTAEFGPGDTDYNGLFTVNVQGGPGLGATDAIINSVPNFIFNFDPSGLSQVTITFNEQITGFSALWSNTFVQDGFRVSTPFNDYDLNDLADPLSTSFIGVQEASGFNSITFTTTNNIPGDDFVFFTALQWSVVPTPGAASLLGIAGLAAVRRRR